MSNNNNRPTRYWRVTCNTAEDDPEGVDLKRAITDIETLFEDGKVEYAIGSWERGGTTNRLHIQAYVLLYEKQRGTWLSGRMHRAYVLPGAPRLLLEGIAYACDPTKEGFIEKAFELGEKPTGVTQGKRTDLELVNEAIANGEVATFREVNDLRVSVAANHSNWVKFRLAESARDEYFSEQRYDESYKPYVWQYWMTKYLNEIKPSERMILFLVDSVGHGGKTRFCHEYIRSSKKRCQDIRAMPKRDMVAALENRREILFLDVPRGRHKYMDTVYVFMEEAKDGKLASEKYNSTTMYQPRMHVVVFMNEPVDIGSRFTVPEENLDLHRAPPLTHDRYAIWDYRVIPELGDVWSPSHQYGSECPPFTRFDEEWNVYDYTPPFVPTSGPAFNGDMAGDGPHAPDAICLVKVHVSTGSRVPNELGEHLYVTMMRPVSVSEWSLKSELVNRFNRDPNSVELRYAKFLLGSPILPTDIDEIFGMEIPKLDTDRLRWYDWSTVKTDVRQTFESVMSVIKTSWLHGPTGPKWVRETPVFPDPPEFGDRSQLIDPVEYFYKIRYCDLPHAARSWLSHEENTLDSIVEISMVYTLQEEYELNDMHVI